MASKDGILFKMPKVSHAQHKRACDMPITNKIKLNKQKQTNKQRMDYFNQDSNKSSDSCLEAHFKAKLITGAGLQSPRLCKC